MQVEGQRPRHGATNVAPAGCEGHTMATHLEASEQEPQQMAELPWELTRAAQLPYVSTQL